MSNVRNCNIRNINKKSEIFRATIDYARENLGKQKYRKNIMVA